MKTQPNNEIAIAKQILSPLDLIDAVVTRAATQSGGVKALRNAKIAQAIQSMDHPCIGNRIAMVFPILDRERKAAVRNQEKRTPPGAVHALNFLQDLMNNACWMVRRLERAHANAYAAAKAKVEAEALDFTKFGGMGQVSADAWADGSIPETRTDASDTTNTRDWGEDAIENEHFDARQSISHLAAMLPTVAEVLQIIQSKVQTFECLNWLSKIEPIYVFADNGKEGDTWKVLRSAADYDGALAIMEDIVEKMRQQEEGIEVEEASTIDFEAFNTFFAAQLQDHDEDEDEDDDEDEYDAA